MRLLLFRIISSISEIKLFRSMRSFRFCTRRFENFADHIGFKWYRMREYFQNILKLMGNKTLWIRREMYFYFIQTERNYWKIWKLSLSVTLSSGFSKNWNFRAIFKTINSMQWAGTEKLRFEEAFIECWEFFILFLTDFNFWTLTCQSHLISHVMSIVNCQDNAGLDANCSVVHLFSTRLELRLRVSTVNTFPRCRFRM